MTDVEVLAALTDQQTLGLTAWAEARKVPRDDDSHSPVEELIAVMVVCRNRRPHFAMWLARSASYKDICLAPNQFSCWNPGTDPNHVALMNQARLITGPADIQLLDPEVEECLYLAAGVISGVLRDRTGNADSYWAPAAMQPPGRVPSWAVGKQTLLIGDQKFLRV